MLLSLIIPFFNEEEQIPKTLANCFEVLEGTKIDWEIIAIDDGSTDKSWQILQEAAANCGNIRAFHFSRNFGKEAAICAGLDLAEADAVILMDGDLQHPPEYIPKMLSLWEQGYEVVEGRKSKRGKESFLSKLNAGIFYGGFRRLSGYNLTNASDYKLLDQKVVKAWRELPEQSTFFRALSLWLGFKRTSFDFEVAERGRGNSKWKVSGLLRLSIDAITGFSAKPLYLISLLGLGLLFVFFVLAVQTLVRYFAGKSASGFTTVILLQLLIGSSVLISLGLIGIYIGRLFTEIKGRPRYIISDAVNMTRDVPRTSLSGSYVAGKSEAGANDPAAGKKEKCSEL